jgi:uncharacterized membrane protein
MVKETGRLEAFSDGVFGIAMTLLVLEFKVPHFPPGILDDNRQLVHALLDLWPSLVAFLISFGTILTMWVNHHGLFRHAHRVDNRLLFANGFLLLVVTFVPFPTAVLAEYLDRPAANTAAAFYCGTFILINIGYNLLLWAVEGNRHPTPSPAQEADIIRIRKAYRLTFGVYVLATIVSLFSALAGLAICLSLWIVWTLLPYAPGNKRAHAN